ncbi:hypothetical protein ACHAWT_002552 [Skeletonema menzelii]
MPKDAKTDTKWRKDLRDLARRKPKSLRGKAPPKTSKFFDDYNKIINCPAWNKTDKSSSQQTLFGKSADMCNCGYEEYHGTQPDHWENLRSAQPWEAPAEAPAPAPTAKPPPPEIPFGIPKVPTPFKKKVDVRDVHKSFNNEGEFPFLIFCYTCGKCPHCGTTNITDTSVNLTPKIIYTSGWPRFVQGMGMKCCNGGAGCGGPGWQTFESTYVATLPLDLQLKLNAVIVGASGGIDMELIMRMRANNSAASIEDTSRATLTKLYAGLEAIYHRKVAATPGCISVPFPAIDEFYVAKAEAIMKAFIRDYINNKDGLNREWATIVSQRAISVDHQHSVARKAKGDKGEGQAQSFSIVGDGGLVLSYVVVPSTELSFVHDAMMEIVERHGATIDVATHKIINQGNLPKIVYVDTNCCNGKLGSRNDDNKYWYGMIKKLDAFHLLKRVGNQVNDDHPRKGRFMQRLSQCAFTPSKEDMDALEAARKFLPHPLTDRQKKSDRSLYVRRYISQDVKMIVAKFLLLLQMSIAQDKSIKRQHVLSGDPCKDISKSHDAYPLISKKVMHVSRNQCIHFLNGCVHDEDCMNIDLDKANYRGTGVFLNKNKSARGTTKNEVVHSVTDRVFYSFNNLRSIVFDAKAHWKLTNMNRRILKRLGKPSLPPCVSPLEVTTPLHFVKSTPLKFGFEYFYHVKENLDQKVDDEALEQLDRTAVIELDDVDADVVAELDIYEDEEGDTDSDTAAAVTVNDEILDVDIPDSVDMDTFRHIVFQLDDAVDPDFDGDDDDMSTNFGATLQECGDLTHQIAGSAGFDKEALYPDGVNIMDNLQNVRANSRRNVGLRQRQSQQTNAAKAPDFTEQMKAKWIELWSTGANPSDNNISFSKWYTRVAKEYKAWKMQQLVNAAENGEPVPQLFDVNYDTVKEWADRMKSITEGPLTHGAFNAESARLDDSFDSFISETTTADNVTPFEEEGGIGVAASKDDINLTIQVETPSVFEPPKSGDVAKLLPKRAQKKATTIDEVFIARRAIAKRNLEAAGIDADEKVAGKKRCKVCDKYFQSFEFNGAMHLRNNDFCPAADDPNFYHEHTEAKRAAKREVKKKYIRKKRAGDKDNT